jgi:hypothetical protein
MDALLLQPIKPNHFSGVVVQVFKEALLASDCHLSEEAYAQRISGVGIIKTWDLRPGIGQGHAFAGNQVQAAGLVRTNRAVRAGGAKVAFVNQPNLAARDVGSLDGPVDEFLQELLHRLLVSDIQQQVRSIVRVEPTITGWFHDGQYCRTQDDSSSSDRTVFRTFNISTLLP